MQAERRDPQVVELAAFAKAGQLLEHLVHVGADFLVGGEQAEVGVELGGAWVVIAGRQVRVAAQLALFPAHQ